MEQKILFIATNGAGLGHLTRSLAVAKKVREKYKEVECIFLTTSLATEVIRQEGFMYYYFPTRNVMPTKITSYEWNKYVKRWLQDIIAIHDITGIIFDGAYPYASVVSSIKSDKKIKGIWIKREKYKQETRMERLEEKFDQVIVPSEFSEEIPKGEGNKVWCPPIVLDNTDKALEREEVREQWGIKEGQDVYYVQLGAGRINDIKSPIKKIITGILENPKNQVILAESIIGSPLNFKEDRVKTIRSYPNNIYFKGIDYAVSAVGYNTFHELMAYNVPTIFVPNELTVKDDQVERAMLAHQNRAGICLRLIDENNIRIVLNALEDQSYNIKRNQKRLLEVDGAKVAAEYIMECLKK